MVQTKKIHNRRMVLLLFWLCWVVYFCTYIGRLNYSAAMSEMIENGFMDKSQGGLISTMYFTFYAIGQLINGLLGDKLPPKRMIFIGVFFAGAANLFMGLIPKYELMVLFWAINGYAMSMVWAPIVRIFTDMFKRDTMMKCFVNISSTMALGTLCSYLLSALMMANFGWEAVFFAAAGILIVISVLWLVVFPIVEKHRNLEGIIEPEDELDISDVDTAATERKPSFFGLIFSPAVLIILIPVIVHGAIKDGVTSWVPTYISETFATSPVISSLASMVLPVINLSGAYAAQFVIKKIPKSEPLVASVFFTIALIALVGLLFFAKANIILTVVLLAIITSSMLAINTTFISFVPMHFRKIGRAATMSGYLNSVAYFGSALSSISIGLLVSSAGWSVTIMSWCAITAVALVVCILGRNARFGVANGARKDREKA